jgi:Putative Ig domain
LIVGRLARRRNVAHDHRDSRSVTVDHQRWCGVTFNRATATLNGIPRSGTSGRYPITFTAANGGGTVRQAFTLTVT